jgi:hypothetical protein
MGPIFLVKKLYQAEDAIKNWRPLERSCGVQKYAILCWRELCALKDVI